MCLCFLSRLCLEWADYENFIIAWHVRFCDATTSWETSSKANQCATPPQRTNKSSISSWSEEFFIMKEDVRVLRAVADFLTQVAAVRQWASVCLWMREQRRKWRWAQMCSRLDIDFFSQFSACQMPVCPHKHSQTSTSAQPVISCPTRKTWNTCTFYESNHSLHIKH